MRDLLRRIDEDLRLYDLDAVNEQVWEYPFADEPDWLEDPNRGWWEYDTSARPRGAYAALGSELAEFYGIPEPSRTYGVLSHHMVGLSPLQAGQGVYPPRLFVGSLGGEQWQDLGLVESAALEWSPPDPDDDEDLASYITRAVTAVMEFRLDPESGRRWSDVLCGPGFRVRHHTAEPGPVPAAIRAPLLVEETYEERATFLFDPDGLVRHDPAATPPTWRQCGLLHGAVLDVTGRALTMRPAPPPYVPPADREWRRRDVRATYQRMRQAVAAERLSAGILRPESFVRITSLWSPRPTLARDRACVYGGSCPRSETGSSHPEGGIPRTTRQERTSPWPPAPTTPTSPAGPSQASTTRARTSTSLPSTPQAGSGRRSATSSASPGPASSSAPPPWTPT